MDVDRPLLVLDLSLERLLADIVSPHEEGQPFFLDGVQVQRGKNLQWLRIYKDKDGWMSKNMHKFHHLLGQGHTTEKPTREGYELRMTGVLKAHGEDVTSRVLTVYTRTAGQTVKDWLFEEPAKKAQALAELVKVLSPMLGGLAQGNAPSA